MWIPTPSKLAVLSEALIGFRANRNWTKKWKEISSQFPMAKSPWKGKRKNVAAWAVGGYAYCCRNTARQESALGWGTGPESSLSTWSQLACTTLHCIWESPGAPKGRRSLISDWIGWCSVAVQCLLCPWDCTLLQLLDRYREKTARTHRWGIDPRDSLRNLGQH